MLHVRLLKELVKLTMLTVGINVGMYVRSTCTNTMHHFYVLIYAV